MNLETAIKKLVIPTMFGKDSNSAFGFTAQKERIQESCVRAILEADFNHLTHREVTGVQATSENLLDRLLKPLTQRISPLMHNQALYSSPHGINRINRSPPSPDSSV